MVMQVELSNGGVAIVDDEHYDHLSKWRWHKNKKGYARRTSKYRDGYMHRTILIECLGVDCPSGMEVDHINRNKLDNRLENLRIVEKSENRLNGGAYKTSSTGVRGVVVTRSGKFMAQGSLYGKKYNLGRFESLDEAKDARKRWEIENCLV